MDTSIESVDRGLSYALDPEPIVLSCETISCVVHERRQAKVINAIVERIPIFVIDLHFWRDIAILIYPRDAMRADLIEPGHRNKPIAVIYRAS